MPSAVCLESLVEIRSAVLEKAPVNDKRRAQAQGWIQIRQRFSGMAWPTFVRFSLFGTEFIRPDQIALFFLKKFLRLAAMLDLMLVGPAKSDIFAP